MSAVEKYRKGSRSRHPEASWALEQEADAAIAALEAELVAMTAQRCDGCKWPLLLPQSGMVYPSVPDNPCPMFPHSFEPDYSCNRWAER